MFIGEAPGVNGCAYTGIPFTSERAICQGQLERHFHSTRFVIEGDCYEGSAGYMWEAINSMQKPPILWNVFPLHPYKIKNDKTENRPPRANEKEWGKTILKSVLDLFPNVSVFSIGNHAKDMCEKLGIETSGHLIHPAHHAKEFREQFRGYFLS